MQSNVLLEMQNLLSGLCDGELSESEHARLEELLSGDVECRQIYLQYTDLHSQLIVQGQLRPISSDTIDAEECVGNVRVASASATIPSSLIPHAVADRASGRGVLFYRYFLVVLATLTASNLVQVFWWQPAPLEPAPKKTFSGTSAEIESLYVATLREAVDCVWETPATAPQVGTRLAAGDFRIPRGIANVQFDSGPELVIEGPAEFRLESSTVAIVFSGKVVLRADESAAPFDLLTPTSILAEIGTVLAVAVSPDAEEVHVFEGEVQRMPKAAAKGHKPEHLKAGEAWRYDSKANAPGRRTKCDPGRFVRNVGPSGGGGVPSNGLLAYEGFDYRNPMAMASMKMAGGKGWIGPWKAGFTRPIFESDRPRFPLNSRDSLARANADISSVGGSFDFAGFTQYFRRLARPVRLNTDGAYYLSFLFHRHGASSDSINAVAIQFWTNDDFQTRNFDDARQRLYVGVKKANQLTARHQAMDARTSVALNNDSTYLLVAKITASRTGADQVQLRTYSPDEAVDPSEPTNWTLSSAAFQSDLVFDWLQLHINSKTRQTIDEVRLGATWSAVTMAHLKK